MTNPIWRWKWGELIIQTLTGYCFPLHPVDEEAGAKWSSAMEGKEGKMQDDHVTFFGGTPSHTASIGSYYFVDFLVFLSASGRFVSPVSLEVCLFGGKKSFVGRSSWPLKRGPHRESIIQASYRHSSRWSFTVSMKKAAKKQQELRESRLMKTLNTKLNLTKTRPNARLWKSGEGRVKLCYTPFISTPVVLQNTSISPRVWRTIYAISALSRRLWAKNWISKEFLRHLARLPTHAPGHVQAGIFTC